MRLECSSKHGRPTLAIAKGLDRTYLARDGEFGLYLSWRRGSVVATSKYTGVGAGTICGSILDPGYA
jgi:hypothetical protein